MIASLVALALLVRAIVLRIGESGLKRRLTPIEAKLIDPGRAGIMDPSDQAWGQWQAEDLQTSLRDGSEPHTRLPTQATPTYRATWEYIVDGKLHRCTHSQSSPVFQPDQIRFGRVQVFYDRDNPSVSRPFPGAGAEAWAWFVGAAVVAAVGLVMTAIENGEAIVDALFGD